MPNERHDDENDDPPRAEEASFSPDDLAALRQGSKRSAPASAAPKPPPERILDMARDDRPREKMQKRGPEALTNEELLAIFYRTGIPGANAITLARELLAHYGGRLGQVAQCNLRELSNHRGLGLAKAAQILAALELGRRLGEERYAERGIHSPDDVFGALGPRIWTLSTEVLIAILLNARSRLIKIETISQGTLTEAAAHPREILRPAIAHSAYAFILVHNHPSGDPSPSRADRALTRRIREAAEIIGIHFHDHVIIGQPSAEGMPAYFSFAEEGMM